MELSEWERWWRATGSFELRRVLMEAWDPIGVSHAPEAADEYDDYVGPVGRMLREGATQRDLRRYLGRTQRRHMGLPPAPLKNRKAARAIMDWWAKTQPAQTSA